MYNTVMIVDDSNLERFITEVRMKKCRFAEHILSFNSGIEALRYLWPVERVGVKFPDIIFLDIYMPLMNGFEFLDEFLKFPDEIKKHCRIVVFSSTDAPEDHARMKTYPIIWKFLSKPLTDRILTELIL